MPLLGRELTLKHSSGDRAGRVMEATPVPYRNLWPLIATTKRVTPVSVKT